MHSLDRCAHRKVKVINVTMSTINDISIFHYNNMCYTCTTWMTNTPNIKNDIVIIERSNVGSKIIEENDGFFLFPFILLLLNKLRRSIELQRCRQLSSILKNVRCNKFNK